MSPNSFKIIGLLIVTSFFILISSIVQAQIPSAGGLELSVSSDNPIPGQTVTITARSYSVDINAATITWVVDGKNSGQGTGKNTLNITAPVLGRKMTVQVTAVTPDGLRLVGSATIGSGSIDMILESNGYVSPLFLGKLQPIYQNAVKIVAVPHLANASGVEYDPTTLLYKWSKNDRAVEDQSGYGKQSIKLVGELVPRPYTLSVIVSSRDGNVQGQGRIDVTPVAPFISFYINDPLYGALFNRVVGNSLRIGSQKETSILAVPYGFNKPITGLGDLALSWLINGTEHVELASTDSIVLRAPNESAGSSDIQLKMRNNEQILQSANTGFTASFSAKESTLDQTSTSF
jgi:hypothetical protein